MEALENPKIIKMRHFNKCGIYFLFRRGVLVYIGQSTNIYSRIIQHEKEGKKEFDSFCYQLCHINLLNSEEEFLIKKYTPEYNLCHVSINDRSKRQLRKSRKSKLLIESIRVKIIEGQSYTDRMIEGF
jgi:excinuclease UvrABC nuclease subunit